MDECVIVSTCTRDVAQDIKPSSERALTKALMVMTVNECFAGASEILSGAL